MNDNIEKDIILNSIKYYINEFTQAYIVNEDDSLYEDLELTDIEIDEMCSYLEDDYDIEIKEKDIKTFKVVADIVDFIYDKIPKKKDDEEEIED